MTVVLAPPPLGATLSSDEMLLAAEEPATLWLWAWPRLLGWPRRVNWLFSPVTGNAVYPGDLWGLDAAGTLIVVETKLARAETAPDPFEDFPAWVDRDRHVEVGAADNLRRRWNTLREAEFEFERHAPALLGGNGPPTGLHRGLLPYSRHRLALWRWRDLYWRKLHRRLGDGYARAIERSLRLRRQRGASAVAVVGLIATVTEREPLLSTDALRHRDLLVKRLGEENVVSRLVRPRWNGQRVAITASDLRAS